MRRPRDTNDALEAIVVALVGNAGPGSIAGRVRENLTRVVDEPSGG